MSPRSLPCFSPYRQSSTPAGSFLCQQSLVRISFVSTRHCWRNPRDGMFPLPPFTSRETVLRFPLCTSSCTVICAPSPTDLIHSCLSLSSLPARLHVSCLAHLRHVRLLYVSLQSDRWVFDLTPWRNVRRWLAMSISRLALSYLDTLHWLMSMG